MNSNNQMKESVKELSEASVLIAINKPVNLKATKMISDEFTDSTWIVDSGASFHMTSHLEWLNDYRELNDKLYLQLGDDSSITANGKGFIDTNHGIINNVYYVPELSANLLSIAACDKIMVSSQSAQIQKLFSKREKLNCLEEVC